MQMQLPVRAEEGEIDGEIQLELRVALPLMWVRGLDPATQCGVSVCCLQH